MTGNGPLNGKIPIAGAKNACLALMPVTLLTDEPVTLTNAPILSDIKTALNIGAFVSVTGSSVRSVTGIKAKQAFFAPAIEIFPFNGPFPVTNIESKFNPFELSCLKTLTIAP